MRSLHAASSLVMAFTVAACAIKQAPDAAALRHEALPEIQVPGGWVSGGGGTGAVSHGWLVSFGDPMLEALVTEALIHNADLRAAVARVEQASSSVQVAAAGLYPTVSLMARGGAKLGGDPSGLQGVGIFANWEIDLWGRLRYARAAAEAQFAATSAEFEYGRQSIAALVAKSWFLASEARLQREIAARSHACAERLVSLAKDRERVGRGDAVDVANASANAETLRDGMRQLELAYEQSVRALELLLGRYPAAALEAPAALPPALREVPVGLPSELLERRPDVIAAQRRVAVAFNRTREAEAARLPRISLVGGVSTVSSELFVLKDRDNPLWSAGGSLVAPIYQGGALRAEVKLRTAEQKQAVADYARVGLRAFSEVEGALSAGFAALQREQIQQRAASETRRALALAEERYRVGSIDLRPVQQQLIAVQAAQAGLVRMQTEQLVQRVNLHLALGGGW